MPTDSEGRASRGDWTFTPPASMARLEIHASFSEDELTAIKRGVTAESSDDKWFIYWHEDRLWVHRSWTGFLIYTVLFRVADGGHEIAEAQVSTDRTQYTGQPGDDPAFLEWLIRCVLLGDGNAEMPMPEQFRDSEEAPPVTWTTLDTLRTRIATAFIQLRISRLRGWLTRSASGLVRSLLWRLTHPKPRLDRGEIETIVAKLNAKFNGTNWRPLIRWVGDPTGACVTHMHRDGPIHDHAHAAPYFVDQSDGLVTMLYNKRSKSAVAAFNRILALDGAMTDWTGDVLPSPPQLDRWVQTCLSGSRERYRFLPTEFTG